MQLLRSLIFVPANQERMLKRAAAARADAIVIDLEDAVPSSEKPAARKLARRWIGELAGDAVVYVRVNGIETGMTRDDLLATVRKGLAGVILPKAESAQDLRDLDVLLREAEVARRVRPGDIRVIPLIESARGVLWCEEIARAIDRVDGIAIGAEDYTRDIGVSRDAGAAALQHMRGVVVQVAAAYGLASIDTPYADYGDIDGLVDEARLAKNIGLKGKFAIHPSQVAPINDVFSPSDDEVAEARAIIAALDDGLARGAGSVSLNGRMVDAPIAERARAVLALAERTSAKRPRR